MHLNFLTFTSKNTLFLLDVNSFIASPTWFNPVQIRNFDLNPIMKEFSGNLYSKISTVTKLMLVDRWMDYMSVYIVTRFSGVLMIEINKPSFANQKWLNAPLRLNSSESNEPDPSQYTPLMLDGRLLFNYYNHDYESWFVSGNNQAMGLLIKHVVMQNYHVHILRIININSHLGSLVYHDFYIQNTTEWINLNINDDKSGEGKVEFSALCDATIYRYTINLKESLVINTKNPYWVDPDAKLMVNITQNSLYYGVEYSSQINLQLKKEGSKDPERSSYSLTIQIIFISWMFIFGLITVKIFFSE